MDCFRAALAAGSRYSGDSEGFSGPWAGFGRPGPGEWVSVDILEYSIRYGGGGESGSEGAFGEGVESLSYL